MRYLLDSDTLIAAKNLHYRPDFCRNFWSWLEDGHSAEKIFSIDVVKRELRTGDNDDFLRQWAERVGSETNFFLSTKGCMAKWGKVAAWAHGKNYRQGAIDKFLHHNAADAWLIAYSLVHKGQFTIVTNEAPAPDSKKSIKLPDAAQAMGVPVMNLYDLLSKHGANNFNFQI